MTLSGVYFTSSLHTVMDKYHDLFGLMLSMADTSDGKGIFRQSWLKWGNPWMLDNGMFVERFVEQHWLVQLNKLLSYRATCRAIVIPDAVGDKQTTLEKWRLFAPRVRAMNYPLAFVSQDGIQVNEIPWDEFNVLFIGGSNQHKLDEAWPLIREAHNKGKWVHVGRVNSVKRILTFWMADSWDGTTLGYEPSLRNQYKLANAIKLARTMRKTRRLL